MIELCKCKYCVLKLAEEGVIIFQNESDQRFQLPALSVSAVDVAGTNDCGDIMIHADNDCRSEAEI